jgi:riboflavin transporter 2
MSVNKFWVHLLSLQFGFGSWIAMTGFGLELPLLIHTLPESWAIGSYINVMIQVANVSVFAYWFAKHMKWCDEVSANHIQFVIGACSCFLSIFFWKNTIYVFGQERSIYLFLCVFGLAIVDCASSVTFLPFMARFDSKFLTTYLIGEGKKQIEII